MTDATKNRYDIKNLPISKTTKDSLTPENIDQISTIGRMLSLQDDFLEELLGSVLTTVKRIETRLTAIELRLGSIERRLDINEERILKAEAIAEKALAKALEDEARLNIKRKEIDDIKEDIKTLATIQKVVRFWTWKNWYKIAGIFIAIIAVVVVILVGVVFYMHKKGWVSQGGDISHNKMTIEEQMRITNAHTRSLPWDSIPTVDAMADQKEQWIINSINERDRKYKEKFGKSLMQ
jgi:hypothetical protein